MVTEMNESVHCTGDIVNIQNKTKRKKNSDCIASINYICAQVIVFGTKRKTNEQRTQKKCNKYSKCRCVNGKATMNKLKLD